MSAAPLPPIEFLRECLAYEPATGAFTWRRRPATHFSSELRCAQWNTRHAGTPALVSVRKDGYLAGEVVYEGRRVRLNAARVAFLFVTGEQPEVVDHKNGVVIDNGAENLRAATNVQNVWNLTKHKQGKILPRGVVQERGKFVAGIAENGKRKRIGSFSCPTAAHLAYRVYARAVRGEFFNPGPWPASGHHP